MKDINYQLAKLCQRSRDGARATQADRHRILQKSANDLFELGFKLKNIANLKTKHIEALVAHWQNGGVSDATLKNRLASLRWLADHIGKAGMVPADNEDFGITFKGRARPDRAKLPTARQLNAITDPYVGVSLRLQMAFGLRAEEAIKLRPVQADEGTQLRLQASWTKGGRARVIPIETAYQRALLDVAKQIAGDGSLIPRDLSYKQQRNRYYYQLRRPNVDLRNPHALRHAYARGRYQEFTGFKPTAEGGPNWHQMTRAQRKLDREARRQVSEELGHNRISVTNTYLGAVR